LDPEKIGKIFFKNDGSFQIIFIKSKIFIVFKKILRKKI